MEMHTCFLCGRICYTERHHLFPGANRRLSEEDGLVVNLCHACHNEPPNGAHFNREIMLYLKRHGQAMFEQKKIEEGMVPEEARKAFMRRYGKNYIYTE